MNTRKDKLVIFVIVICFLLFSCFSWHSAEKDGYIRVERSLDGTGKIMYWKRDWENRGVFGTSYSSFKLWEVPFVLVDYWVLDNK